MKSKNFEIKKVVTIDKNSTATSDAQYWAINNHTGEGVFCLNYDEFEELVRLSKNFLDCWTPDCLLYSDGDLIDALKKRGYKGKLTKTREVEL